MTRAPDPSEHDAAALRSYYEARAPEYDDWYLRRGRYARGPHDDEAWAADLARAGEWLDQLPVRGQILEIATGTGWWSPRLATRGELTATDAVEATLEHARTRMRDARLTAEFLVRDAWAEPDRTVDVVFTGFWLSHLHPKQLDPFLGLVHRWLVPGGLFAAVDSLPDRASGARDHPTPTNGRSVRRLDDGREFEIVKVFHSAAAIRAGLAAAGFRTAEVTSTDRFFQLVQASG